MQNIFSKSLKGSSLLVLSTFLWGASVSTGAIAMDPPPEIQHTRPKQIIISSDYGKYVSCRPISISDETQVIEAYPAHNLEAFFEGPQETLVFIRHSELLRKIKPVNPRVVHPLKINPQLQTKADDLELTSLLKAMMSYNSPINLVLKDFRLYDAATIVENHESWIGGSISRIKTSIEFLENFGVDYLPNCLKTIKEILDELEENINFLVTSCGLEEKYRDCFVNHVNEMEGIITSLPARLSIEEKNIAPFIPSIERMKENITSPAKNLEIIKKAVNVLATIIEKHKVINLELNNFDHLPCLLGPLGVRPDLKQLKISGDCTVESKDLNKLSQAFPSLQELHLSSFKLPQKDITFLKPLTQLTTLNMGYGDLQSTSLGVLQDLTNLTELNLTRTNLQDIDVVNIAAYSLPKLKILFLCCNLIGNDGILAVIKNRPQNFPQLNKFHAVHNLLNDAGAKQLVEILGMQYDPESFYQYRNNIDSFAINVARNKVTQPVRTDVKKEFSQGNAGTSGSVSWSF